MSFCNPIELFLSRPSQLLLNIADEFIDTVTNFSCRLAKHRGGDSLEIRDLQLHLGEPFHTTAIDDLTTTHQNEIIILEYQVLHQMRHGSRCLRQHSHLLYQQQQTKRTHRVRIRVWELSVSPRFNRQSGKPSWCNYRHWTYRSSLRYLLKQPCICLLLRFSCHFIFYHSRHMYTTILSARRYTISCSRHCLWEWLFHGMCPNLSNLFLRRRLEIRKKEDHSEFWLSRLGPSAGWDHSAWGGTRQWDKLQKLDAHKRLLCELGHRGLPNRSSLWLTN